jgi:hypothetical protein
VLEATEVVEVLGGVLPQLAPRSEVSLKVSAKASLETPYLVPVVPEIV